MATITRETIISRMVNPLLFLLTHILLFLSENGNEKPFFYENTNDLTKLKLEYQRQRLKNAVEYSLC
jgi:hypothetical protein